MHYEQHTGIALKPLILNLIRAIAPSSLSIHALIRACELFGYNANQVRVTVNRLVKQDRLRLQDRGVYGLSSQGTELWRFSQSWRQGETRLTPWQGEWFCTGIDKKQLTRNESDKSKKALWMAGFRAYLGDSLYIRPRNLALNTDQLQNRLRSLGLATSCQLWISHTGTKLQGPALDWLNLWHNENWQQSHELSIELLQKDLNSNPSHDPVEQLVKSFHLGNQAIELLIRDPLLPNEIASGDARILHTEAMMTYDRYGRSLWLNLLADKGSDDANASTSH